MSAVPESTLWHQMLGSETEYSSSQMPSESGASPDEEVLVSGCQLLWVNGSTRPQQLRVLRIY